MRRVTPSFCSYSFALSLPLLPVHQRLTVRPRHRSLQSPHRRRKNVRYQRRHHFRYDTTTSSSGEYYLTNLPPGLYQLEIEKSAFKKTNQARRYPARPGRHRTQFRADPRFRHRDRHRAIRRAQSARSSTAPSSTTFPSMAGVSKFLNQDSKYVEPSSSTLPVQDRKKYQALSPHRCRSQDRLFCNSQHACSSPKLEPRPETGRFWWSRSEYDYRLGTARRP